MTSPKKSEPKCTEIVCSTSVGGKVQIVKFEYTADFHYSMSRKFDIPEDWNEQDVHNFQVNKETEMRTVLEGIAQAEMEELIDQRERHAEEG